MSKRLEDEYRQMILDDVPDLWDRIEAGLTEKSVSEPVNQNAEKPEKKKKPVILKILPWAGGITAAALILIVALPVILIANLAKKAQKTESAVPMNAAYMEQNAMTAGEDSGADFLADTQRNTYNDEAVMFEPAEAEEAKAEGEVADNSVEEDGEYAVGAAGGAVINPFSEDAETGQRGKMLLGQQQRGTKTEFAEEYYYAVIDDIRIIDEKQYCTCAFSEDVSILTDPDENVSVLPYRFAISDDSDVEAEIGGTYRIEFDGDEIVLLERMN